MNKLIIYSIVLLCLIVNIYANDKPKSFITSVGTTYRSADVDAHNIAYMNGLKITGKRVVKNGDVWVITVTTVPRY